MKPESLYIHIPFCIRKCIYCDFLSFAYDESLARRYVDALCRELELKKNLAGRLKTVYIGGGTPTVLPEESFRKLFKCLKDNFHFPPSIEMTVEANPGTLNESKISTLIFSGVNRLSIGVQSLNDNELKALGRIHTAVEAVKSIEMIKKAGISNFSIDLMYGVPGQTINTWEKSLSKAVRFSPTHLSSYELTPEKNTPLYRMIKAGEIKMPDEDLVLEMYNYAIDYLTGNGYEHYEISNFAFAGNYPPSAFPATGGRGERRGGISGFRCIHNLNYWERGEYIGAGAGAHSFIGGCRSKNTDDIRKYIEGPDKGAIPETESEEIRREDAIKEFIFLGLRKTEGISVVEAEKFGFNLTDSCMELVDEGCLEISGNRLRLTCKGLPIANLIIVRVFESLNL